MTSRASIAATVVALLALPTACGDDGPTGPQFSPITGTWIGTEFEITFTFEIVEDEAGEIRGPIDMSMGDDVVHAMVVSGRREGAHVVLVVGAQGFRNSTFRGDLSDDGMMVLGVSGFGFRGEDEFRLVLRREPSSATQAFESSNTRREHAALRRFERLIVQSFPPDLRQSATRSGDAGLIRVG